jgi:hypothetical protein
MQVVLFNCLEGLQSCTLAKQLAVEGLELFQYMY